MRQTDDGLTFSATDLSNFFECEHRLGLELQVAAGALKRPQENELERELLERRGREHEQRVLDWFRTQGKEAWSPDEASPGGAAAATEELMRAGAAVIYQGTLQVGSWLGRPDFLWRVEGRAVLVISSTTPRTRSWRARPRAAPSCSSASTRTCSIPFRVLRLIRCASSRGRTPSRHLLCRGGLSARTTGVHGRGFSTPARGVKTPCHIPTRSRTAMSAPGGDAAKTSGVPTTFVADSRLRAAAARAISRS